MGVEGGHHLQALDEGFCCLLPFKKVPNVVRNAARTNNA